MATRSSLLTFLAIFSFTAALAGTLSAQKPSSTPRQEKLLNGLKVLVWNTPGADKTVLKLRIHAGSAFDPQEKEGVMKLLAESFFPTPDSRSFFVDELGGSLEVESGYDHIQINASSRSGDFLTLLETVAQAIANPDLSKEVAASLKSALTLQVQAAENDSVYVADRAVARRLFGTFPYGRPNLGTVDSLQRVDFADLRFAKDRLITADNATLAITGSVEPALAFRAVRRNFGAWAKADRKVPSTFRQPDDPAPAIVKVEMPGITTAEVRYATRGFSRSSKEFPAAEIYAKALQARLSAAVSGGGSDATVVHDEHILPGAFVFRYRSQASPPVVLSTDPAETNAFRSILSRPITDAEFAAARAQVLAARSQRDVVEFWLDVDTFRLGSVDDEARAFQNVVLADVNSLASRLAKEPVASALVIPPAVATSNNAN